MLSRSPDRCKGERLESSRGISWTAETKFYLSALVLSLTLYFAGSEAIVRYLEWVRSQTSTALQAPAANPPPPAAPAPTAQQLIQIHQTAQRIARENVIANLTATIQYHPDKGVQQQAQRQLQQLVQGEQMTSEPLSLAMQKTGR